MSAGAFCLAITKSIFATIYKSIFYVFILMFRRKLDHTDDGRSHIYNEKNYYKIKVHGRDGYRYKVDSILLLLYSHSLHTVLTLCERIAPEIVRKMMNYYNKTLI